MDAIVRRTRERRVIRAIAGALGVNEAQVGAKDSFIDDLGVDATSMRRIARVLSKSLSAEISDGDAKKFRTVPDVVRYVAEHEGDEGEEEEED